jgi:hypothetical protein
MSRNDDPMGYNHQAETGATTASRPPQYNCGYRCGEGCCEPLGGEDEGGGSEYGSEPTLIDDEEEREDILGIRNPDFDPFQPGQPSGEFNAEASPIVIVDASDEHVYLDQNGFIHEDISAPSQSSPSYSRSPSSLENHAPSEPRSGAASEAGHFDRVSPMEMLAGLGDPFQYTVPTRRAPQHYFVGKPLRLSHKNEDCRGYPASHRIIRDYSMLLNTVGDSWTPWIPRNETAL